MQYLLSLMPTGHWLILFYRFFTLLLFFSDTHFYYFRQKSSSVRCSLSVFCLSSTGKQGNCSSACSTSLLRSQIKFFLWAVLGHTRTVEYMRKMLLIKTIKMLKNCQHALNPLCLSSVSTLFHSNKHQHESSCVLKINSAKRDALNRASHVDAVQVAVASLTTYFCGGVLWDHGVGGELWMEDAAVRVGVHGQAIEELTVLLHALV